jgi:hypothetical protein
MISSITRWAGRSIAFVIIACLVASSGCGTKLAPAPTGMVTTAGDGTVAFYRWKDGQAVMICCDIQGGSGSTGGGTDSQLFKQHGSLGAPDGRRFAWELETTDGRSVKCRLDGKEHDLSRGASSW